MNISYILQGAGHEIDGSTSHGTDMATSACLSTEGISAYWRSEGNIDVAFDKGQPTNRREEVRRGTNRYAELKGEPSGLVLNHSND